ncbi:MAG: T9SS type A sorting domain-containing protein, partial [Bacteroidales bacterium]|nr:T9SS type A sorting domain-containing protein [Bacteroidales bacterium]
LKEMEYSTWLSRIIHMDMTEGDCASWSFWTAFTRAGENSDHRWRFGLFWWIPDVIDHTNTDGEYYAMKNLWTLGNYSRFIRPESKRMQLTRSDGKTFKETAYYEFASAYYTQDTSQVVVVVTNYAGNNQKVKLNVTNLVPGLSISEFTPYLTSDTTNLKKMPVVSTDAVIELPAMSIMTLVADVEGEVSGLDEIYSTNQHTPSFTVIPNPANDYVTLRFDNETKGYFIVTDLSGKVMLTNQLSGTLTETINLEEFNTGIYIIKVFQDGIVEYQKLLVN